MDPRTVLGLPPTAPDAKLLLHAFPSHRSVIGTLLAQAKKALSSKHYFCVTGWVTLWPNLRWHSLQAKRCSHETENVDIEGGNPAYLFWKSPGGSPKP